MRGKFCKAKFVDLIGFMQQAGFNPLPPATGSYFIYPGPRNHDGLLFEDAPEAERLVTVLMGDKVDPRREYISMYANFNREDKFIERVEIGGETH